MANPTPPLPKAPLVLLGLLTLATMAGPVAILLVVRGGDRPDWPPDRPVEWWTLGTITAAVVLLMLGCVTSGLWAGPRASRPTNPIASPGERTPASGPPDARPHEN